VFAAHGLSISLARLHTEGARVTDVFTAVPVEGLIDERARLDLQTALLASVSPLASS